MVKVVVAQFLKPPVTVSQVRTAPGFSRFSFFSSKEPRKYLSQHQLEEPVIDDPYSQPKTLLGSFGYEATITIVDPKDMKRRKRRERWAVDTGFLKEQEGGFDFMGVFLPPESEAKFDNYKEWVESWDTGKKSKKVDRNYFSKCEVKDYFLNDSTKKYFGFGEAPLFWNIKTVRADECQKKSNLNRMLTKHSVCVEKKRGDVLAVYSRGNQLHIYKLKGMVVLSAVCR